jgi:hypothetical protein
MWPDVKATNPTMEARKMMTCRDEVFIKHLRNEL